MILASIGSHNNLFITFELFNFVKLVEEIHPFFPIGHIGP
jgi:hypothetical protein